MGPPIYIGGNANTRSSAVNGAAASMGPPIYIGGNVFRYCISINIWIGFNGATDLHRWKLIQQGLRFGVFPHASMGPPIYIGGNLAARSKR